MGEALLVGRNHSGGDTGHGDPGRLVACGSNPGDVHGGDHGLVDARACEADPVSVEARGGGAGAC